jgi:hypothetical protein
LDLSRLAEYEGALTALTKLQHLRNKILPLTAHLQASLGIISGLEDVEELFGKETFGHESKSKSIASELRLFGQELQGYILSIQSLKSQSEDIFTLVSLTSSREEPNNT